MKYLLYIPIACLSFGVALGAEVRLTLSDDNKCTCDANGCYGNCEPQQHKKGQCWCDGTVCYNCDTK